ncbi:HAD-IA family hydrolase [Streptomyces sp. NPDC058284]|uniref:HAD-IA family hydrolase n=1 Tax=unclassified Streptomyces TaxID=2593676 RepID=UPI003658B7EA
MPSPPPRNPHEAPKSGRRETWIRHLADTHRKHPDRQVVAGHHNINYVVPLGWSLALLLRTMPFRARVKCRMPRDVVEVVPRIWPSETELLAVVSRHLKEVPRCFRDFGDWSLHSYRAGQALSEVKPHGPVGEPMMRSFAEFFARAAGVPEAELPPRPAGWPESGRSQEFLHWLIDYTEDRVHGPNRWRFDDLFAAVGIRPDAISSFRDAPDRPPLTPRPFCLLHTDVHRANVIVGRRKLAVIDWESAMYGDPLHDLATHVVRMDYEKEEQVRMERLWAEAMRRTGHADMTAGMAADLRVYLDFEYAQSVFPDIMRAALGLTELPGEPDAADYAGAAVRVCRALRRAAEPLRLAEVPDEGRAERALRDWYRGPFGRAQEEGVGDGMTAGTGTGMDTRTGGGGGIAASTGAGRGVVARELRAALDARPAAPAEICFLFDFDGPVCRLFPDGSSKKVADALREHLRRRGVDGDVLTPEEQRSIDPHDVLRAMDRAFPGSELIAEIEELLTAGEVTATHTAPATPGAHELIRGLRARGVRLAVVTNNSPRAVAAYLHRHRLTDAFGPHIYGRTDRPSLLKPHPDSLERALRALGAEPADALMIGDTATDLAAARDAKVLFVGYAPDAAAAGPLREAGAELIIPTLRPLLGLLDRHELRDPCELRESPGRPPS